MLQFYYDLLSQPSRALYIFLKLNKIPFEANVVKLGRGEHKKSCYKEINRFQLAPCIIDNGFKLSETVAIFRYLVASNPTVADHWYPKDCQERAKVDEYLEWQHTNTRMSCTGFVRAKYMEPLLNWSGPSAEKIAAKQKTMEETLDLLENIWLKDQGSKSFLATKEISFADILAASELETVRSADYDPFQGRPNLTKWHALVKEKTNPTYDEAHVVAYSLVGTYQMSRVKKLWKIYFSYNY